MKLFTRWLPCFFVSASLTGLACGSSTGSSPFTGLPDATTGDICVAGMALPCPCPGGGTGEQICLASGAAYGACVGCVPAIGHDAGVGHDAGLGSDTGVGHDSGAGHDATTGHDSSTGTDSGTGVDSGGGGHDAGSPHDAGRDAAPLPDPTTCAEALTAKSYVGCEFYPTQTANIVWTGFDFAAVVANAQAVAASVTVTGPSGFSTTVTVPANGLTPIYLPWVPALKGLDVTATTSTTFANSISVSGGAYHLVSSVPVTVYQFNALEYQGVGGPPGKDWSQCPDLGGTGCFSFTNDASILFPVAAMTSTYRVNGEHGSTLLTDGPILAITGTAAATTVTVQVSSTGSVTASLAGDIVATSANGTLTFGVNAGDVVELVGAATDATDLSGSLVTSTHPIQVISARQCANQPDPIAACDHLESTVLPAETLGTDYVVTVPTSPHAAVIGHVVRFVGNVDGTVLTYSPSAPPGCPTTLNAGQVVQCIGTPGCATGTVNDGSGTTQSITCVAQSFEVKGTHEFAVSSFMLGGSAVDSSDPVASQEGDPSMSPMVPVEEFRSNYTFLAPTDYTESYADIVAPPGIVLTLDGTVVATTPTVLNASWSIYRLALGAGVGGAHYLSGTHGFGAQIIGYGAYTSYQYPAGFDLDLIAPPPLH